MYMGKILLNDKMEIADKIAPTVAEDVYDEDKLDIVFANSVTTALLQLRLPKI